MRSYRDLWLWLGGVFLTLFAFLAALAIANFVKEPHYALLGNPWMVGACLSFLLAFFAFFGAMQRWEFSPVVRPGFPDITIDLESIGSTDTERESSSGLDVPANLRSFHARFANLERDRSANLTVTMYVKVIAGSWGRAAEVDCPAPSWTLPPSLGLVPMSMPLDLAPGQDARGQLVYEIPRFYLSKISTPLNARLEITDHVSGKRMSVAAELGHYDKAMMTPASGGAQTLGPEFQPQPQAPLELPEGHRPGTAMEQA